MCWYTNYVYNCLHAYHNRFVRLCLGNHCTPCGSIQLVPHPRGYPVPPCPVCADSPSHPWSIIWGCANGTWTNFSPGEYDLAGGVPKLYTDKTCESDGDSSGIITPRALELQQRSSLSTSSSSSLPAGGDYFSFSQEYHHRQGLYQTLTIYQPQDISLNYVFTLKPLLPQMKSRFAGRPAHGDPSRQNLSPTTNVAGDVGVAAETSLQLQAIKRPYPGIRPVPTDTVTLAPRSQQSVREAMPPPPLRPAALNSADNTKQFLHIRGRHFSSLSSMLSTEPTAPGPYAVSQKPDENTTRYLGISVPANSNSVRGHEPHISPYPPIPPTPILRPVGLHTTQIPNAKTQDYDHLQPAQAMNAEYPQRTDLLSIKQARLLGCPQYWVQRAGEQWEQDMEKIRAEKAMFEVERREWMERVRSRRTAKAVHGRGEVAPQARGKSYSNEGSE